MTETLMGTELTCRQFIDFIQDFLDGELSPRERTVFELHLTICPDCVNYLQSYQTAQALSKMAAVVESEKKAIPDELVQAILAARKNS
jgi:anti-sigma factor RsiW